MALSTQVLLSALTCKDTGTSKYTIRVTGPGLLLVSGAQDLDPGRQL